MVNLAMAEAVARERHADHLKEAGQARAVKTAARKPTAQQSPTAGNEKFQIARLANLIVRFGRA